MNCNKREFIILYAFYTLPKQRNSLILHLPIFNLFFSRLGMVGVIDIRTSDFLWTLCCIPTSPITAILQRNLASFFRLASWLFYSPPVFISKIYDVPMMFASKLIHGGQCTYAIDLSNPVN